MGFTPFADAEGGIKPTVEELDDLLAAELERREADDNLPWYTKVKWLHRDFDIDPAYASWLIGRFRKRDDTRVVMEKWNRSAGRSKSTWVVRWRDDVEQEQGDGGQ